MVQSEKKDALEELPLPAAVTVGSRDQIMTSTAFRTLLIAGFALACIFLQRRLECLHSRRPVMFRNGGSALARALKQSGASDRLSQVAYLPCNVCI